MALTPIICTSMARETVEFWNCNQDYFFSNTHTGAVLCSHHLLDYNKTTMLSLWWEHSDPGVIYNLVKPCPHCWPHFFFFLEVTICFFNWCLPAVTTLLDSCQQVSIFWATYYLCTHFLWVVVVFFLLKAFLCSMFRQKKTWFKNFSLVLCLTKRRQLNRVIIKWIP